MADPLAELLGHTKTHTITIQNNEIERRKDEEVVAKEGLELVGVVVDDKDCRSHILLAHTQIKRKRLNFQSIN